MTFKALDIEKDVVAQGFSSHSYDLIVANLVLHATKRLEETMQNVRRLLKPGGYLLLLEITNNDQMRFGFIFGGLSGWWLGNDDGRRLSPCITSTEWHALLKKTGFSGIDAEVPHHPDLPIPMAVMVSQAVDEHIIHLRQPLASPPGHLNIQQLTIIGGASPEVSQFASNLGELLSPHCNRCMQISSLSDLNTHEIPFMGTVLCLTELDKPIFKCMTAELLQGFQQLFRQSKNVLWLTRDRRMDDPYSNMVIGFGRTLVLEMPHLRLQFLDFRRRDELDARKVAEILLQLEATDLWEQQGLQDPFLWTVEPELALEDGNLLVPRILLDKTRNDRYNSAQRQIMKEMDPKATTIQLTHASSAWFLREEQSLLKRPHIPSAYGSIQVKRSILRSLKVTETDYLFLLLGSSTRSGEQVVVLSQTQQSIVQVREEWCIPCPGTMKQGLQFLLEVYSQLVSLTMLAGLSDGDVLAVFEPSPFLALALTHRASEKGVQLLKLTNISKMKDRSWLFIHPNASTRSIKEKLPTRISCFVDLSRDNTLVSSIVQCLPYRCRVESLKSMTATESHLHSFSSTAAIDSLFRLIRSSARIESFSADIEDLSIVAASNFPSITGFGNHLAIVDWTTSTHLPVQVEPVDSKPIFSNNKTYWLVGLTGGLGLSLCQWMVDHGARYIVLSSRNPKIAPRWLDKMSLAGVNIKVAPK